MRRAGVWRGYEDAEKGGELGQCGIWSVAVCEWEVHGRGERYGVCEGGGEDEVACECVVQCVRVGGGWTVGFG